MPVPAASRPELPRSKSNPNLSNSCKPRPELPFDPNELCRRLDLAKLEGDAIKNRRKSLGAQLTTSSSSRPASVTVESLLAKSIEHHCNYDVNRVHQRRSGGPSLAPDRLARPTSPQPEQPEQLAKRLETHERMKENSKSSSSDTDDIQNGSNASVIALACMPPTPKTSAKNASSADPNPPSGPSKKRSPQLKAHGNPSKQSTTTSPSPSPLPYNPVNAISSFTSTTSPNTTNQAKVHPLSHQVLTMYSNPLSPLSSRDKPAQQLTPRQLAQLRRRTFHTTDRLAARNQFSNSAKWVPLSPISQNFMANPYSYAPHPQPSTDFLDLSLHGPGSTVVPLGRSASEGQKRKPRPRSTAFEQFSTARPSILITGADAPPVPRSAQPYVDWSQRDEEISSEEQASNAGSSNGNRLTVNFSLRRRLSRESVAGSTAAQRASMGGQRSSRVVSGEGLGQRSSRALGGEFFAQRNSQRYSKDGAMLTTGITNAQRIEKRESVDSKRRRERAVRERAVLDAQARREREGGGIEMGSSPVLPALSPFPPLTMPGQIHLGGVGRRASVGQVAAVPVNRRMSNDRLSSPVSRRLSNGQMNGQINGQLNRRTSSGQMSVQVSRQTSNGHLNKRPSSGQLSGHSSRRTSSGTPVHQVPRRKSNGHLVSSPVHRRKSSGSAQIRLSNAHIASQVDRRKSGNQLSAYPHLYPAATSPAATAEDRGSKRASRIAARHTPIPQMTQGTNQGQGQGQGQLYPSIGVPARSKSQDDRTRNRGSVQRPSPAPPAPQQTEEQAEPRGRQSRHSLPAHSSHPRSKSTTSLRSAKSAKSAKSTFSMKSTKSQRNTLQKRRRSDARHVTQEQLDALAALTAPVPPPDATMTPASVAFLEEQKRRLQEKQRRESLVSQRGARGGRDSSVEGSVRMSVARRDESVVRKDESVASRGVEGGMGRRPESALSGSVAGTEPFPAFKGKGKEKVRSEFDGSGLDEKNGGSVSRGWDRESMVLCEGESLAGLTPESVRLLREREKLVRWKAEREKAEFERKEREKERVAAANEKWDSGEKGEGKKKRGCLGGLWPF